MQKQIENLITNRLEKAEIQINGNNPWDIIVHDKRFYNAVFFKQNLGAGESYMQGFWDCKQLDELFFRICRKNQEDEFNSPIKDLFKIIQNTLINQQSPSRSMDVTTIHYNLDNHLYEQMLGKSMAYTCGYWKEAKNLDEAQFAKYELVCKKLYLKAGDKVLEIGSGWGGLAKYMAEKYQCEVVALDIGTAANQFAKEHCKNLPIQLYQCDYRDIETYNHNKIKFDKIVSIGVLEHVGYKNYKTLMSLARQQIKDDGLFLLHSIGGNTSKRFCDAWIDKYIFPHGMLPSIKQLGDSFENQFIVEDLQNFGAYYDPTLMAWYKNLNEHWPSLKARHSESFRRMMEYYLLSCAGTFRARGMQLWQYLLTPEGLLNGYISIR